MHRERCVLYGSGEMPPVEAADFKKHADSCAECRALLETLRAARDWSDSRGADAPQGLVDRCIPVKEEKEERKAPPPVIPWLGAAPRTSPWSWGWLGALSGESGAFGLAVAVAGLASLGSMFGPGVIDYVLGRPPASSGVFASRPPSGGTPLQDETVGDSLGYLNRANRGSWGSAQVAAPQPEEKAPAPAKQDDSASWAEALKQGAVAAGGEAAQKPSLPDKGFGKLSSSLAGGSVPGGRMGTGPAAALAKGSAPGSAPRRSMQASADGRRLVASSRLSGGGPTRGALGQLKRTAQISQAGRSMAPDAARAAETAAFDSSGAGTPTEGGGVGEGGPSAGPSDSGTPANPARDIKDTVPEVPEGRDSTPWQSSILIAGILIALADLMLLAAAKMSENDITLGSTSMAGLLAQGAILLSLAVVGIGYGIMRQHGQAQQGQILMLAGGVAASLATLALVMKQYQKFLLALAGVSSGIIAAIGMFLKPRGLG